MTTSAQGDIFLTKLFYSVSGTAGWHHWYSILSCAFTHRCFGKMIIHRYLKGRVTSLAIQTNLQTQC